jgi:hypothetical protein
MLYPTSGLSNGQVGGTWNEQWDAAFKVAYSSPLAAIRTNFITKNPIGKTGYMGGTGGKLQCDLCLDAGGVPGKPLAAGRIVDDRQFPEWVNNGGYPLIVFPQMPLVVAGQWYHFLFTNVDPDPVHNFSSLDFLTSKTVVNGKIVNPDPNSKVMFRANGGAWKAHGPELIASPFALFYANGLKQGNGGYQLAPDGSTMCGEAYGFGGLC